MNNITLEDFGRAFGTSNTALFSKEYLNHNFNFRYLNSNELAEFIQNQTAFVESDTQKVGIPERKDVWEKGWSEPLHAYKQSSNLYDTIPKFIREREVKRYNHQIILPDSAKFELGIVKMLQTYLFKEFFHDCESVCEFGAGSGLNTVALATLYPNKKIFASDYTEASIRLLHLIADREKLNIHPYMFDLVKASEQSPPLPPDCGVFTMGALEQLAGQYTDFIDYLIQQNPKICVHVEPTIEVYENSVLDNLAINFHTKRNYSVGLIPYLESKGVDIIKIQRTTFGSKSFEGYTIIIWRTK